MKDNQFQEGIEASNKENKLVLLIDDNKSLLKVNSKLLSLLKYDTICFSKSKQALSYLEENIDLVDIVITDFHMNPINGSELTKAIRMLSEEIPIILCTGNASKEEINNFFSNGGTSILWKPFSLNHLNSKLKQNYEQ